MGPVIEAFRVVAVHVSGSLWHRKVQEVNWLYGNEHLRSSFAQRVLAVCTLTHRNENSCELPIAVRSIEWLLERVESHRLRGFVLQ